MDPGWTVDAVKTQEDALCPLGCFLPPTRGFRNAPAGLVVYMCFLVLPIPQASDNPGWSHWRRFVTRPLALGYLNAWSSTASRLFQVVASPGPFRTVAERWSWYTIFPLRIWRHEEMAVGLDLGALGSQVGSKWHHSRLLRMRNSQSDNRRWIDGP